MSDPPPAETLLADLEAEQGTLGALLLDPDTFVIVSREVDETHFAYGYPKAAFHAFAALHASGVRPDAITVREWLDRHATPPEGGWDSYLARLCGHTPSAAGAEHYARIVAENAERRALHHTFQRLDGDVGTRDLGELREDVVASLLVHRQTLRGQGARSAEQVALELAEAMERGERPVPTGLRALDRQIGGLAAGELIVLAGRPSMGKTALAGDISEHVAGHAGAVLYVTLEMSARSLLARLASRRAEIPLQLLVSGTLNDAELDRVVDALAALSKLPLHLDDRLDLGIGGLMAEAQLLKAGAGLALIVVDYLQLMTPPQAERREQEIAQLSRGLKALAKRLKVPVLCLSQLNRDLEKRGDKRPMLADLRESGAIEQDADKVLLLYRPWVYDKAALPTTAFIDVAKQRNGPTGSVEVEFCGERFEFRDRATGGVDA